MKRLAVHALCVAFVLPMAASAQNASTYAGKPATEATKRANAQMAKSLDFNDKQDFEDAERGLIARPDKLVVKDDGGRVVWDMESYKAFIGNDKPAPDTVNPSLWRNAQLNMNNGLFKVTDRVYQVRGYDLSNITFVQGDTGWIVGDPLISPETAKAAYELVTQNLGKRPIVAVIYTHSHADHYGGVRGIVDEADVKAGKVKIIAPEHFVEEAVSENVIAGNAMGRRAVYMGGSLLPRSATGGVNAGLGQTGSTGMPGLLIPTDTITRTGETLTVDGVKMVFQMTPGTEAPAEMNVFFPPVQGDVDGRKRQPHAAQPADLARRAGAQWPDLVEVPRRVDPTVRAADGGGVRQPPLADVGQCAHRQIPRRPARSLQIHPRPIGEPDEQGLHRYRNRRHDPAAAFAGEVLVQPRLLRHGQA